MIEVMVVSTVTWLSAMLPKVEAMRFCISLANMDWSDHRCLRNTTPSRLPHLPSHLNSFMYIYDSYHILHLFQSLCICSICKITKSGKIYVFHWFITIRPSDCSSDSDLITIQVTEATSVSVSGLSRETLKESTGHFFLTSRIGFWLENNGFFPSVSVSRQGAFLAPRLGEPQQTLLEFPVTKSMQANSAVVVWFEKHILTQYWTVAHGDTGYNVIIRSVSTAFMTVSH